MGWFGLSRWSIERAARPWGDRASILRFLESVPPLDATCGDSPELPDADTVFTGGIRWAAGAMDGVGIFHMGRGDPEAAAQAVWSAVVAVVEEGSDANVKLLHDAAMREPTSGAADAIVAKAREAKGLDPERASRLARWLTREAADREVVKLGIVLLGVFGEASDARALERLARHEEFTLFAVVALGSRGLLTWLGLWEIAKSVHGWGRVHAVGRLRDCEDPRVRRWLLREGFRNAVMDEYLALICAEGGDLVAELSEDRVDVELLDGAASMLAAVASTTQGGPSSGFEAYSSGVEAVRGFLRHAVRRAGSLEQFLGASRLLQFIESTDVDWAPLVALGWSEAVRKDLASAARRVVELPEWPSRVLDAITSPDRTRFGEASAAAADLGIDVWEAQFARLRGARSAAGASWWHVCRTEDAARMDRVIAFAEETLPLDRIASGPAQHAGFGEAFRPHRDLDWVLAELRRFPGRGWPLVRAGLRSPMTRNRNMAVAAFSKWDRGSWPTEAQALLEAAAREEPGAETRENIERLLRGESLVPSDGAEFSEP